MEFNRKGDSVAKNHKDTRGATEGGTGISKTAFSRSFGENVIHFCPLAVVTSRRFASRELSISTSPRAESQYAAMSTRAGGGQFVAAKTQRGREIREPAMATASRL